MYLNPSIFPKKLIRHLTRFDYMYWKNRHHFVRKFRFDSNMASHVGSTIRDNRSFRNETWRRRRDGYGVPYGLAYQRGRGTRTSRVPLISRQHAPLIISLITATWTWREGALRLGQRQHTVSVLVEGSNFDESIRLSFGSRLNDGG